MTRRHLPTFDELLELDNLCLSQADDLRYDHDGIRLWTSRMTIGDGVPYRKTVCVERYIDGCWILVGQYDGENPPLIAGGLRAVTGNEIDLSLMKI